jgi:NDP-sugar pyrophosphorylase family protein
VQAMVLAAGVGRRLRPLTDRIPKALVEVAGVSQLERTLTALETAGAQRIVVNIHHHAQQIESVLAGRRSASEILVSREETTPLETGGGLVHARELFRDGLPILVHNVDIITSVDLKELYEGHDSSRCLATLAVQERPTSRYLMFDDAGLQGRLDVHDGRRVDTRPIRGPVRRFAFSGIHVVSGSVFDLVEESGAFSLVDLYLRLSGLGWSIQPVDVTAAEWFEIGTLERLRAARVALGD